MQVVSNVLKVRKVVIAITFEPARHKRHMQFLTSAPNVRGHISWPPDPAFPSPNDYNHNQSRRLQRAQGIPTLPHFYKWLDAGDTMSL